MQSVNFSMDEGNEQYWDNVDHAEEHSLGFLNQFGAAYLVAALQRAEMRPGIDLVFQDLTGDGVKELAFGVRDFYVFSCENGQYVNRLTLPPDGYMNPARFVDVRDLNRDGVPEMMLLTHTWSQGGHAYQIHGWDGSRFRNLLVPDLPEYPESGEIFVEAHGNISSRDVDGDGVLEVVAFVGMPVQDFLMYLPWRDEWEYYRWDGTAYRYLDRQFGAPEYRFQAVQDGDRLSLSGRFVEALASYQQAIFNDELEWWTVARRQYLADVLNHENWGAPAPTSTPLPDPNEYPNLAAYSRYRIMLLHLVQGWEAEAKIVYETLQVKFPEGTAGHAYAEMAAAFWHEYEIDNSVANGCRKAVQFAERHAEEVLPYLGSGIHGLQDENYEPSDVCPFN